MENFDLKKLIELVLGKKWVLLIFALVFALVGTTYVSFFKKPMYSSSLTLIISKQAGQTDTPPNANQTLTQTEVMLSQRLVTTYSELMKSRRVSDKVKANLNIEPGQHGSISVSSVKETEIIKVTAFNREPNMAATVANETAKVFKEEIKEMYKVENVAVIDSATVSNKPYNMNKIKDIGIFTFIGLVLALSLIIILYILDTTIKDPTDVEDIVGLHVLASIPICQKQNNPVVYNTKTRRRKK